LDVTGILLGTGLILAGASYVEVRKLLQAKASVEREKKQLLREFLNLKKKMQIPEKLTCFNCGRNNYCEYFSIALFYDKNGKIDKAGIYCPVCLKQISFDRRLSTERYVGRAERFIKEVVIPAGFTQKGGADLMRVAVNLLRR